MKSFPCEHAMLDAVYARILPERGHDVAWVMWGASRSGSTDRWRGTAVHLVPAPSGGLVGVLRSWFRLHRAVARVARTGCFDVIQVRNSVGLGCLATWLRAATGARFVFQLSFPVLEGLMEASRRGAVRNGPARRLAAIAGIRMRGWVIRRADLVLTVSDEMRDRLVGDGLEAERVVTFPLGADDARRPSATTVSALRERLELGADPVVLYAGAVSPGRRLDFLVDVADRVLNMHASARFLIVGPSSEGEDERLRARASERGIGGRVLVLPRVPRSQVPAFIASASVAVSPVPLTELYRVSSPTKAVEALALGCPVVVTPIRDQAELVVASGGGIVAAFEPGAFADAVSLLLSQPDAARAMGRSGRAYVRRNRSYTVLAEAVEAQYLRAGVHLGAR